MQIDELKKSELAYRNTPVKNGLLFHRDGDFFSSINSRDEKMQMYSLIRIIKLANQKTRQNDLL